MPSPGSWDAFQDLLAALRGIRGPGSGYWTDLGGRVFTEDLTPDSGTPFPFGVLVFSAEDVEECTDIERAIQCKQTIEAVFWLGNPDSEAGVADQIIEATLKLRDDVRKAVFVAFYQKDSIKNAGVVRTVVGAGAGGKHAFGTLSVTIAWEQMQDLATLGP